MDFDISFANEISAKTPNLCHLAPAGPTYMEDLNEAGGVYAVMNELNKKGLLHTECMTVTGKTVGENIKDCVNLNPEVIRPDVYKRQLQTNIHCMLIVIRKHLQVVSAGIECCLQEAEMER